MAGGERERERRGKRGDEERRGCGPLQWKILPTPLFFAAFSIPAFSAPPPHTHTHTRSASLFAASHVSLYSLFYDNNSIFRWHWQRKRQQAYKVLTSGEWVSIIMLTCDLLSFKFVRNRNTILLHCDGTRPLHCTAIYIRFCRQEIGTES